MNHIKTLLTVALLLLLMFVCTGAKFGGGWILQRSIGFNSNMSTPSGSARNTVLLSANYYTYLCELATGDSFYTKGVMWEDGTAKNFSNDSANSDTTCLYFDAFLGEYANVSAFMGGIVGCTLRVEVEQALSYNVMITDSIDFKNFGFFKTDTLFETNDDTLIVPGVSMRGDYNRQYNDYFQITAPCVRFIVHNLGVGVGLSADTLMFDFYVRRNNNIMGGSSGRK